MKIATICLLCKGQNLLLGVKKKGFGAGKINAPGGKVKEPEKIKSAAAREIFEEAGIQVEETALQQVAVLQFYFETEPIFEGHVFLIKQCEGEAKESDEMKDFQWYSIEKLPFDEMWVDDRQWMPLVLSGKKIEGRVDFNSDGSEVKNFLWKEVKFD